MMDLNDTAERRRKLGQGNHSNPHPRPLPLHTPQTPYTHLRPRTHTPYTHLRPPTQTSDPVHTPQTPYTHPMAPTHTPCLLHTHGTHTHTHTHVLTETKRDKGRKIIFFRDSEACIARRRAKLPSFPSAKSW